MMKNAKATHAGLAVRAELVHRASLVGVRRTLRILSLVVVIAALVGWFALGANRGWTRTTLAVKTVDEVTGIEGIEYQRKFVPGLELLAGALLVAILLTGASFFFRNEQRD